LRQRAKRHKNQSKIDSLFYYLKACDGSPRPVTDLFQPLPTFFQRPNSEIKGCMHSAYALN
jgi:hypothetical protein